jgi:adhesin transport system membrane fusion protein
MPASSDSNKRGYFDSFGKSAEAEFMPETAGAALQDSPRKSRITVWLAAALLIAALVWAKFAVLEEVTMGEGKAIPSSKVQVIQNLEGGIVTEIFVREGQMVGKGDTLLRLDDTRFRSTRARARPTVTR